MSHAQNSDIVFAANFDINHIPRIIGAFTLKIVNKRATFWRFKLTTNMFKVKSLTYVKLSAVNIAFLSATS